MKHDKVVIFFLHNCKGFIGIRQGGGEHVSQGHGKEEENNYILSHANLRAKIDHCMLVLAYTLE